MFDKTCLFLRAHGIQQTILEIKDEIDQGGHQHFHVKVEPFFVANADDECHDQDEGEEHESGDREKVKVEAVVFAKGSEQIHLYNDRRYCLLVPHIRTTYANILRITHYLCKYIAITDR